MADYIPDNDAKKAAKAVIRPFVNQYLCPKRLHFGLGSLRKAQTPQNTARQSPKDFARALGNGGDEEREIWRDFLGVYSVKNNVPQGLRRKMKICTAKSQKSKKGRKFLIPFLSFFDLAVTSLMFYETKGQR
ncbi:MAG: hypothetical protein LBI86_07400 [Treponema sp.]|jgi:hypothetical protein|nr:hypothetical protein [Treponema sp.]